MRGSTIVLAFVFALAGAGLLFVQPARAQTSLVTSIAALQAAINGAAPGDVIQLADGTYLNASLSIGTSNITVQAQTPGGVYLNGSDAITISGSYDTFSGFQFTSGSISGFVITVTGSHNTLTQLNFNGYSAQKYIVLKAPSHDNSVTWSNFQNKPASAPQGNLIHIDPDASVPGYDTISHNSFQHMPGAGGDNGNEPIRIGNGAQSTYSSRTVVEYNYFEDTGRGDSEAISVKSRDNTLRWNTMRNNPDAMFVFRNGDNNVAYGNFFIYSGGIRVKEANNIWVYNNHFEYAGVGGTMNAVTYDYVSPNLKNVNFIHNTFFEPNVISLGGGATGNTWANNLLTKTSGSLFSGSASGIAWAGNLYHGSLGITIPAGGATEKADVGLVPNAHGFQGLVAGSPAIDAASSNYPAVYDIPVINDDPTLALDVEGQSRPLGRTQKDVGADELSDAATTNQPLTLNDVGPSYLRASTAGGIGGSVTDSTTGAALAGATVSITGGASTTTDGSGRYAFAGLAPGSYTLAAAGTGYTSSAPAVATVTAGATTTLDFALAALPPTSTGWIYATTASAVTTGAGDNNGYESGAANLFASDGLLATDANSGTSTSKSTSCTSSQRDKENLSGFSFGPLGTVVKGIEVQLRGRVSSTSSSPRFCVLLSWNGGTSWTAGKLTGTLSTTLTTYTLGTATDTWGRTWAAGDFSEANFLVRIVDIASSTSRTFYLDGVAVRLTYQ